MNRLLDALQGLTAIAFVAVPFAGCAQVPVDEHGNEMGAYSAEAAELERSIGNEDIPLLSPTDLQELVGPIALYPDDLLAIVLPASAYPLQIIEAGRFLAELEDDSSLQPSTEWDDSVVALLNYPEVLKLLNDDIDWTWRLGEAVVAQQEDVVAAIEEFRDRAYAAGNLKSDEYQSVTRNDGVIEITPVAEDVIYVPYYEPERVVVYQSRPAYYYYPRAYPVYYYPYPSWYYFDHGPFWGVTTAFTIGWVSHNLHVYHHSYYGHPYYGHSYWDRWWYRRPSINIYNTTYVRNSQVTINRYYGGDRWRPRTDRRHHIPARQPRVMSHRYQPERRTIREPRVRNPEPRQTVRFRERSDAEQRTFARARRDTTIRNTERVARSEPRAQTREPVARTQPRNQAREPMARSEPRAQTRPSTVRSQPRPQTRPPVARSQPKQQSRQEARQEPQREVKAEARSKSKQRERRSER
ncbi:MAG TPA: DUF3300 domain-containing protein [Woeseiaceae bacterium]|nr:DUF3300 domain-containing protein [Woeseiaceae bacterium]